MKPIGNKLHLRENIVVESMSNLFEVELDKFLTPLPSELGEFPTSCQVTVQLRNADCVGIGDNIVFISGPVALPPKRSDGIHSGSFSMM